MSSIVVLICECASALRELFLCDTPILITHNKGPGNVPWRATKRQPLRTFLTIGDGGLWYSPEVPASGTPCCLHEPNDGCTAEAAAKWLQFSDFYQASARY